MPEGHHPPLSRSSNVEQPRIVGLPLRLETRHRSPLHPPSWSWRCRPGDPPNLVKPAGPLRPWIGDPLFRGAPLRGAGGRWIQLRSTNAERAEPSRVRAANVFPAEGEGGTLERGSGVVSKKLLQGRAWRGCGAFSGSRPSTAIPPRKRGRLEAKPTGRPLPGPLRECTDGHRTD